MDQQASSHPVAQTRTAVERRSDRELVVTRLFDAPPNVVFRAWAEAELFRRWWVPAGALDQQCGFPRREARTTAERPARNCGFPRCRVRPPIRTTEACRKSCLHDRSCARCDGR